MEHVLEVVLIGCAILILVIVLFMTSGIFDSYGNVPTAYQEVAVVDGFLDEYNGTVVSGRDAMGVNNVICKRNAAVEVRVSLADGTSASMDAIHSYSQYLVQLEHNRDGETTVVIFSEIGGGAY